MWSPYFCVVQVGQQERKSGSSGCCHCSGFFLVTGRSIPGSPGMSGAATSRDSNGLGSPALPGSPCRPIYRGMPSGSMPPDSPGAADAARFPGASASSAGPSGLPTPAGPVKPRVPANPTGSWQLALRSRYRRS